MKIRTDFVSNSSSVSYILTMKKDIVELFQKNYRQGGSQEVNQIIEFLKEDLIENGTRIFLEGEELYYKKFQFRTDGDTLDKDYFDSREEEFDLSTLSDDEIWSYIYGEYILKGDINSVEGFGVTKVDTF